MKRSAERYTFARLFIFAISHRFACRCFSQSKITRHTRRVWIESDRTCAIVVHDRLETNQSRLAEADTNSLSYGLRNTYKSHAFSTVFSSPPIQKSIEYNIASESFLLDVALLRGIPLDRVGIPTAFSSCSSSWPSVNGRRPYRRGVARRLD